MNIGNRKNVQKKKRKTFHGNQHSKPNGDRNSIQSEKCSASKRKLTHLNLSVDEPNASDKCIGNVIIDLELMHNALVKCLRCVCGGLINITINNVSGLGCKFIFL